MQTMVFVLIALFSVFLETLRLFVVLFFCFFFVQACYPVGDNPREFCSVKTCFVYKAACGGSGLGCLSKMHIS